MVYFLTFAKVQFVRNAGMLHCTVFFKYYVYVVAGLSGSFRFLVSPAVRSRLSKLVDEEDQGKEV